MNYTNYSTINHTTFPENQESSTQHYQQLALRPGLNISAQGELLPYAYAEPNQSAQAYNEAESEPSCLHRNPRRRNTSEIDRIKIKTAAAAGLSTNDIIQRYGFSKHQIYYALKNSSKPKTSGNGAKPAISQDKARELVSWICREPNNRRIPYQLIPDMAPELDLQGHGKQAIRTAVESQGFGRRTSKQKGFSNQEIHRQKRLQFALDAREWDRERLYCQMFSDEVWAYWGANSRNFVTVQVVGDRNDIDFDRHRPECLTRKASRSTAWMFHGVIHGGKKAFGTFWEWGTMDSEKYDEHILSKVEEYIGVEQRMGRSPWFQHDNAPCHKSQLTQSNLQRRRIPTIDWPPYSPDLNLIEHVWVLMKKHIQDDYLRRSYDNQTISRNDLKELIQKAWDLVRDEEIARLYDSWRDRCDAVIRANGGPTKY